MPTYEYKCINLHVTQDQRNIDDRKRAIHCPECGEVAWYTISAPKTTFKFADKSGIKK